MDNNNKISINTSLRFRYENTENQCDTFDTYLLIRFCYKCNRYYTTAYG